MTDHTIVSHDEWIAARRRFLAKEKEFTRLRDELSRERRELPWERVSKEYLFESNNGRETLADLFGQHSQLIVYHFMDGPDWEIGCPALPSLTGNVHLTLFATPLQGGQLQRNRSAPGRARCVAGRRVTRTVAEATDPGATIRLDLQVGLLAR